MTATATSSNNKEVQLVSSWIHHEEQCVTLARIAQSVPGATRSLASALLQKVASADPDQDYRVAWCQPITEGDHEVDGVPCTVFQLVEETRKGSDLKVEVEDAGSRTARTRTLYALGLSTKSETLHVAHERDLAQCRDVLGSRPVALVRAPDRIQPSPPMRDLWQQGQQQQQSELAGAEEANEAAPPAPPAALTSTLRTKTTAASFFGGKPPTTSASAAKRSTAASATTTASTAAKTSTSAPSSSSKASTGKENQKIPSSKAAEPAGAGKWNNKNSSSSSGAAAVKVGNADDFVGDVESSSDKEDDDDEEDGLPSKSILDDSDDEEKPAPPSCGTTSSRAGQRHVCGGDDDEERMEEEDPASARSAVQTKATRTTDAFIAATGPGAGGRPATRVRKRLVEKTYADEHGYIQTEMQEVWEEVPVEAPAPKSAAATNTARPGAAKPKPKPTAGGKPSFKQGSLNGFFTKK